MRSFSKWWNGGSGRRGHRGTRPAGCKAKAGIQTGHSPALQPVTALQATPSPFLTHPLLETHQVPEAAERLTCTLESNRPRPASRLFAWKMEMHFRRHKVKFNICIQPATGLTHSRCSINNSTIFHPLLRAEGLGQEPGSCLAQIHNSKSLASAHTHWPCLTRQSPESSSWAQHELLVILQRRTSMTSPLGSIPSSPRLPDK